MGVITYGVQVFNTAENVPHCWKCSTTREVVFAQHCEHVKCHGAAQFKIVDCMLCDLTSRKAKKKKKRDPWKPTGTSYQRGGAPPASFCPGRGHAPANTCPDTHVYCERTLSAQKHTTETPVLSVHCSRVKYHPSSGMTRSLKDWCPRSQDLLKANYLDTSKMSVSWKTKHPGWRGTIRF